MLAIGLNFYRLWSFLLNFIKKFCAVRLQVPLSLPIYRLSESTVRNTIYKMRYKDAVYRLIMSV